MYFMRTLFTFYHVAQRASFQPITFKISSLVDEYLTYRFSRASKSLPLAVFLSKAFDESWEESARVLIFPRKVSVIIDIFVKMGNMYLAAYSQMLKAEGGFLSVQRSFVSVFCLRVTHDTWKLQVKEETL